MKKLEVNEENYEMYQKLSQVRNGRVSLEYRNLVDVFQIAGSMSLFIVMILGMFPMSKIALMLGHKLSSILSVEEGIIHTIVIGGYILTFISGAVCGIPKVIQKIREKWLFKKYPDLDTRIDIKELDDALERYIELSKVPKEIEQKKEEHLVIDSSEYKEMTTEERLAFLKQEKEFWEQVSVQEKYQNTNEETTIGSTSHSVPIYGSMMEQAFERETENQKKGLSKTL